MLRYLKTHVILACSSLYGCVSRAELTVEEEAERLLASKRFNMSDKHTAQWTAGKQSRDRDGRRGKDKDEKGREAKKTWNNNNKIQIRMRGELKWRKTIISDKAAAKVNEAKMCHWSWITMTIKYWSEI